MSIENPTLVHFRHFSSLFTLSSTSVENSLQIDLFMQNKPNFRKSQMNVSIFSQTAYENIANWTLGENKPNSNPIKPNCRKAKMNVNSLITKDYRKNDDFAVLINKPNSNPISEKPKINVNLYVIEDYENETAFRPRKNKPNSNPVLSSVEWANFKRGRLLIDPMLPLYKPGNVQYYSRHNFAMFNIIADIILR